MDANNRNLPQGSHLFDMAHEPAKRISAIVQKENVLESAYETSALFKLERGSMEIHSNRQIFSAIKREYSQFGPSLRNQGMAFQKTQSFQNEAKVPVLPDIISFSKPDVFEKHTTSAHH